MMYKYNPGGASGDRPYYYAIDRDYSVVALVDRAGAIVERYAYDEYGRPRIRESLGRGDMDNDTVYGSGNDTLFNAVFSGTPAWDPRADMDDDGDCDSTDQSMYTSDQGNWPPPDTDGGTVAQAFSDVGNAFMFQGVPLFALDTASNATGAELMLNQHRMRFNDVVTGRWTSRDPIGYRQDMNLYEFCRSSSQRYGDPWGLLCQPTQPKDPRHGWGSGEASKGNCYRFAVNDPHDPTNPNERHNAFPGGPLPDRHITCDDLINGAMKDGMVKPDNNGDCPAGTTMVAVVVESEKSSPGKGNDFHWYRRGPDGKWYHKRGRAFPTTKDAKRRPITDPEACDRNYRKPGASQPTTPPATRPSERKLPPYYDDFCGYLCAPPGMDVR